MSPQVKFDPAQNAPSFQPLVVIPASTIRTQRCLNPYPNPRFYTTAHSLVGGFRRSSYTPHQGSSSLLAGPLALPVDGLGFVWQLPDCVGGAGEEFALPTVNALANMVQWYGRRLRG
jgi:hypothetical protein